MHFFARLDSIAKERKTALCVGLDPRIGREEKDPESRILEFNHRLVTATAEFAACYKPNIAFYEAAGQAGLSALEKTLAFIPRDIPVILDAKRGDIDATAEAYAASIFGHYGVAAVTLSPYMGRDAATPFLAWPDKGLFLLCRTSNPGAGAFQDLRVSKNGGKEGSLYVAVARECLSWSTSIGLVVAGNDLDALKAVRSAAPGAWFLSPGIGAQGGDPAKAFEAGRREDGAGVLVVAARSVADAADPAKAARDLRDAMEAARSKAASRSVGVHATGFGPGRPSASDEALRSDLVAALVRTGCFRLGEFTLKSGKKSPFYIDLRRLVADPSAMALAGRAYASLAWDLEFSSIAGIPAAGLPLATVASLATGKPMIWPRMPVKEHGSGNRVEGAYSAGEVALLLDDLVTTGASKLEAVEILRGEGLVVTDLVVLVERGRQGRKDMAAAGIALKAFLHVKEFFAACEGLGLIDQARREELEAYVDAE